MTEQSAHYHLTRPAAVLRATGPDAFTFLQSQFSNDLRVPGVEKPVTYGLWLDAKGKIQADSFILQNGPQDFLLISYDCRASHLKALLDAHLIADEVELHDETAAFGLAHFWSSEPLADSEASVGHWAEIAQAEFWLGRRPTNGSSWDILAPAAMMSKLAHEFAECGVEEVSAEDLQALRIMRGVPSVPFDAGEGDFAQEAGLDRDAVSFDKGCYVGQEIMSRLHTQGHVNRSLWHVAWDRSAPKLGDDPVPLYAGDVPAGELRSRTWNGTRGLGFAMLKTRSITGKKFLSFTPSGPGLVEVVTCLVRE